MATGFERLRQQRLRLMRPVWMAEHLFYQRMFRLGTSSRVPKDASAALSSKALMGTRQEGHPLRMFT